MEVIDTTRRLKTNRTTNTTRHPGVAPLQQHAEPASPTPTNPPPTEALAATNTQSTTTTSPTLQNRPTCNQIVNIDGHRDSARIDSRSHESTPEPNLDVIAGSGSQAPGSARVGDASGATASEEADPSTVEEYDALLARHPSVRESANFEKDDHYARAYYRMKEIIASGALAHLSGRKLHEYFAQQLNVDYGTIRSWFGRRSRRILPRNIDLLGRLEMREQVRISRTHTLETSARYLPRSLNQYMALVKRHPYVVELRDFEKRNRYSLAYFRILEDREKNPNISLRELGRKHKMPVHAVFAYVHGETPDLFLCLASNERVRRTWDGRLTPEAIVHRIDPECVYDVLKPLRTVSNPVLAELADRVACFCAMMPEQGVIFAEIRPYNRHGGPTWLANVASAFEQHLVEMEEILNRTLSTESVRYRLGMVDRNLYIWRRRGSRYDYLNLFAGECFYLSRRDRRALIREARDHLGLVGNWTLSHLLRQITEVNDVGRESIQPVAADMRHDRDHLYGETLRFILDVLGRNLIDVGPQIVAIGQQDQIRSPCILDGRELLDQCVRLYAIIVSDGHVGQLWNFLGYSEYAPERIEIVKKLVQRLGDVRWSYFRAEERLAGLRLPHVLGRLMIKLGIPTGDRTVQEFGVPDFILRGSTELKRAYLQEVIPQDGWVTVSSNPHIGISRNKALYDITKKEQYEFSQKISDVHVEFIQQHGKRRTSRAHDRILRVGKLHRLCDSNDSMTAGIARQLLDAALNNRHALLDDEYKIVRALGIDCPVLSLSAVTWYERTGRVSTTWRLIVNRHVSIAKWGVLAMPNDVRKRNKLTAWMFRNPDMVIAACRELSEEGLLT